MMWDQTQIINGFVLLLLLAGGGVLFFGEIIGSFTPSKGELVSILEKELSLSPNSQVGEEVTGKCAEFCAKNDGLLVEASAQGTLSSPLVAIKPRDAFTVAERGFWQGTGHHAFDPPLAQAIVSFFLSENITSILELGAGEGRYAKELMSAGQLISCYDGNPVTQAASEGRCAVVDLSRPLNLSRHDWLLSLEVGEHIPPQYEDIFISNLVRGNKFGLIVSWAVEGQGGTSHVNCRNNSYIRSQIIGKGYESDLGVENRLRNASTLYWFKDTIMVFRKQIPFIWTSSYL